MEHDGWVRGPALEIITTLRAWRVGDEVEIDIDAWYVRHSWENDTLKPSPFGAITGFSAPMSSPVIELSDGAWMTAHEYIIAWRRPPKKE